MGEAYATINVTDCLFPDISALDNRDLKPGS
jgi:hypothetical protein